LAGKDSPSTNSKAVYVFYKKVTPLQDLLMTKLFIFFLEHKLVHMHLVIVSRTGPLLLLGGLCMVPQPS